MLWGCVLLAAILSRAKICNVNSSCDASQYCHNSWCYDKLDNAYPCYVNEGCLSGRCNLCLSSNYDKTCNKCSRGHLPYGAECNYTEQCYTTDCKPTKNGKFCLGSVSNGETLSMIITVFSIDLIGLVILLPFNRAKILMNSKTIINVLICLVIVLSTMLMFFLNHCILVAITILIPNISVLSLIIPSVLINTKSLKIVGMACLVVLIYINSIAIISHLYFYEISREYAIYFVLMIVCYIANEFCMWKLLLSEYNVLFIKND